MFAFFYQLEKIERVSAKSKENLRDLWLSFWLEIHFGNGTEIAEHLLLNKRSQNNYVDGQTKLKKPPTEENEKLWG